MRTLSIDFDDVVTHEETVETEKDLDWLGDMTPELTVKKSARFITQTIVGIFIVLAILLFI